EPVQFGVGGLAVDDCHAARVLAARRHAIDRRGIVGAVHARRHDHDTLDVERLVQRAHFFGQRHLRRIGAPRKPRKLGRVAVDMRVAIAGARRHIEIDLGRRLRCLGVAETRLHQDAGSGCAEHEFATRNHCTLPWLRPVVAGWLLPSRPSLCSSDEAISKMRPCERGRFASGAALPQRKNSSETFFHSGMPSSVCSGVKKWTRKLPSLGLSVVSLAGTAGCAVVESAGRETSWPSLGRMKSTRSLAAFGCGALLCTEITESVPVAGSILIQSTGAPFLALITAWWLKICSAIAYSPAMTWSSTSRAEPRRLAMFCFESSRR